MILGDNWATKYGYFLEFSGSPNDPTSMNFGGSCAERIAILKKRGFAKYGNSKHPEWGYVWWEQNCQRLTQEYKLFKIQEAKDQELKNKLESERIARQQAEAKRLADVAEAQRLAAIEEEKLRIQLLNEEEMQFKPEIIAASSLIPLVIISYLVFKK
jgi:hypothetical protein